MTVKKLIEKLQRLEAIDPEATVRVVHVNQPEIELIIVGVNGMYDTQEQWVSLVVDNVELPG